jgi:hypothetical protein
LPSRQQRPKQPTNVAPTPVRWRHLTGVNTLNLSASTTPVPDIVALAASNDPGYVDIPGATNWANAMARYCSAQDNVRTRQSPTYRETIRVNVHGRKSMSWAKSVLPPFTGTSPETFRKVPDRVQIDTTLVRQNRAQNHAFIGRHRLLNRTAVEKDILN